MESIRQYLEGRPTEIGEAVFDKEDDLAVEFVTATANLRGANYGIPQQSLFITKVTQVLSSWLCLRNNIETQERMPSATLVQHCKQRAGMTHGKVPCRVWPATSYMPLLLQMQLLGGSLW